MPEDVKLLITQNVFLSIDLQPPALIAHIDEHALAHIPVGSNPAGDGHLATLRIVGARFGALFFRGELISKWIDPFGPQGSEFCFALLNQ